jgi:hypothetical protein
MYGKLSAVSFNPAFCILPQVSKLQQDGMFRNAEFGKGLSVWSASVERCGRPIYAAPPGKTTKEKFGVLWVLKLPLRCPPTVQKALMLVQPSLDQNNVCCFKKVTDK